MIDKLAPLATAQASPPARPQLAAPVAHDAGGEDFTSVLAGFAGRALDTMRAGETAAVAGLKGEAPLQEVVDKVMAAEQALQATLAVREKIVAAWLEINRMTI